MIKQAVRELLAGAYSERKPSGEELLLNRFCCDKEALRFARAVESTAKIVTAPWKLTLTPNANRNCVSLVGSSLHLRMLRPTYK
jgi:hypothetical protein